MKNLLKREINVSAGPQAVYEHLLDPEKRKLWLDRESRGIITYHGVPTREIDGSKIEKEIHQYAFLSPNRTFPEFWDEEVIEADEESLAFRSLLRPHEEDNREIDLNFKVQEMQGEAGVISVVHSEVAVNGLSWASRQIAKRVFNSQAPHYFERLAQMVSSQQEQVVNPAQKQVLVPGQVVSAQ